MAEETMTIGLETRGARDSRTLRNFGLFMAAALPVFAGLLAYRGMIGITAVKVTCVVGAVFLVAALVAPLSLKPVEKVWMALGEKIGTVVTFLIMILTFFLVVTPLGMLRRMAGNDPLGRRFDPARKSYWEPTEKDGPGSRHWVPY